MVVGTFVLILMEGDPARPLVPFPLQADRSNGSAELDVDVAAMTDTDRLGIWRNIVIHDASCQDGGIASECHFKIRPDGSAGDMIESTVLWRRQLEGDHVRVPGFSLNSNSVAICLLGDGRTTKQQMAALISLIRSLQLTCMIARDSVYLHSERAETDCPTCDFSSVDLRSRLLPSS